MPRIVSVGHAVPKNEVNQSDALEFVKNIFADSFKNINRLLPVFNNGQIQKRYFAEKLEWFASDHSFSEKNTAYIQHATQLGCEAIEACLANATIQLKDIDAIIYISTTGLSTPSIEAKIMNKMKFSQHTKRIPIWGLGCAGGASGLARAFEYCLAYPDATVLIVAVELCSLTFQKDDTSKSNFIGTSLFADGAAAAVITGDNVISNKKNKPVISYVDSQSTLMPNSEDVMGWNVRDNGLYVVFSKDIPSIVKEWLPTTVEKLLNKHNITIDQITRFIAHPGGKKVLDAYISSLNLSENMTAKSLKILKEYGNMSSATVLFVLEEFLNNVTEDEGYSLLAALGPGFSSELILLKWGES
ncbi:type III polyketide synthase [Bacillus sp. HMF5848]|uniref:type III polyketide synthase n=1 Tax=Bacillus sp. HMF5848 TaxID=2495421 RepID=UPI000F7705C2|nr:3-oxoacyl-[acyl-carrier-protein] synthase III C-terminal domain-containing protein [Bacillus sp. HMF5848]RSK27331.1 type III polyketide synthase [Bacillus sp. HMF5848]